MTAKQEVSGDMRIAAEGVVRGPTEQVYGCLADYRRHHPRILPPAFSDFVVEQGGVGAGTVIRFRVRVGGRTRVFHQQVDEPEPGRVLTESGIESSEVTSFTVLPEGNTSRVRIETAWRSAPGMAGFFERLLAPRLLRPLYVDELARLDRYICGNSVLR